MEVAVDHGMASRADETTPPQANPAPSDEQRATLPFPPPMLYPSVIQAECAAGDGPGRAADVERESEAVRDYEAAGLPEDQGPDLEEPFSPDEPLEEAFHVPLRRPWPAMMAFVLAGLVVTLVGVKVVVRVRQVGPADTGLAERAGEPRQESRAAGRFDSTDPVGGVGWGSGFEPAPPPSVNQRPAAEPGSRSGQSNGSPEARGEAATHAVRSVPPVSVPSKAAAAKGLSSPAAASATQAAPGVAAQSGTPRAVRHEPSGYADKSTWKRQAKAEYGIPVDQVYINGRGELVDAQGNPLRLDTALAHVPASESARPTGTPPEH
jgi:hypothetical protein